MIKFNRIKTLVVVGFLISAVLGETKWYTAEDGSSYLIDANYNYNWYQALVECSNRNLTLVTISTETKNKALVKILKLTGKDQYWMGGVANPVNGKQQFYWTATGKQFSYTDWYAGEPNGNGNENCAQFKGPDYRWNDNTCVSQKFALLCEETPLQDTIRNEIYDFRSYAFDLNKELISKLQSVKNDIANLMSGAITKAQQTQDAIDKALSNKL